MWLQTTYRTPRLIRIGMFKRRTSLLQRLPYQNHIIQLSRNTLYIGDPSPSLPPPNETRRGSGDVGVTALTPLLCSLVVEVFGAAVDIFKSQFSKLSILRYSSVERKRRCIYTAC